MADALPRHPRLDVRAHRHHGRNGGAVAALYTTPEKIHTYAQAVTTGDALVAINTTTAGRDLI